jgi:hypothetical protein
MQVHRVVVPGSRVESWTVLGDDGAPVAAVESWLAYLSNIGRSPNTVKAYAHDLKDFWVFIAGRGLDWRAVRLDDLVEFVAWLALPDTEGRPRRRGVARHLVGSGHGTAWPCHGPGDCRPGLRSSTAFEHLKSCTAER